VKAKFRASGAAIAAAIIMLSCYGPAATPGDTDATAAIGSRLDSLAGCFHVVRGPQVRYFLATTSGTTELAVDDSVLVRAGGVLSLDRARISAQGHHTGDGVFRVIGINREQETCS